MPDREPGRAPVPDRAPARSAPRTSVPEDEAAFLERYDPERYPRPSVAVDVVLLTIHEGAVGVLLHRRHSPPFKGRWALPGGFVRVEEPLEETARRVLRDKAAMEGVWLEQLYTFGDPARDPRTRVLSVAYLALVDLSRFRRAVQVFDEVTEATISTLDRDGAAVVVGRDRTPLALAFDHARIIGTALTRVRGKLDYTPVGYQLLPEEFTLRQLQRVHETILGRPVNKDSFRRRMLASGELEATGRLETDVLHRPAELYRFRPRDGSPG